jgi:hypothetical protein
MKCVRGRDQARRRADELERERAEREAETAEELVRVQANAQSQQEADERNHAAGSVTSQTDSGRAAPVGCLYVGRCPIESRAYEHTRSISPRNCT